MAETWRARLLGAAGVTKPVLIKKVLAEYANDDSFVAMFISEARISATLSHGSIAQVFDFGRVDGGATLKSSSPMRMRSSPTSNTGRQSCS